MELPHLDKPEVLAQLEGLPAEHFPTRWAEADGWRDGLSAAPEPTQAAPEQAAAEARGGAESSAALGTEPAKVRVLSFFHACCVLLLAVKCHGYQSLQLWPSPCLPQGQESRVQGFWVEDFEI